MADATYQPAVYRKQGGDELVVASSGLITVESGGEIEMETGSSMTFASGSGLALASGSSFTCATPLELSAAITCASGGYLGNYVQTAATTATTILPYGLTLVAGTTDTPSFLMSNPIVGVQKFLQLTGTTADEIAAIIAAATTTVTFDSSGSVALTLRSTGLQGVSLIGATTLRWVVTGAFYSGDVGLST